MLRILLVFKMMVVQADRKKKYTQTMMGYIIFGISSNTV